MSRRYNGATDILLRVPRSPAAAGQTGALIRTAGRAYLACYALSPRSPSTLLYYFRWTGTVIVRKKTILDEPEARTVANSYQIKVYREEDNCLEDNKHRDL